MPAKFIIRETSGDAHLVSCVDELLGMIEDEIRTAAAERKLHVNVELPTCFDIPNMNYQRAQRFVYFHVLDALDRAGYFPRLIITKSAEPRAFLDITWLSPTEKAMEEDMDKYIRNHLAGGAPAKKKAPSKLIKIPRPPPNKHGAALRLPTHIEKRPSQLILNPPVINRS